MSQPVDTQACLSSGEASANTATGSALTQLSFEPDCNSENTHTRIKVRKSPRKRNSRQDDNQQNTMSPCSQTLFDSQPDHLEDDIMDSQATEMSSQQELPSGPPDSPIPPPRKRAKLLTIESQTQEQSQDRKCGHMKTKILANGTRILYAEVKKAINYYDSKGLLVHTEVEELSSPSSTQSSGYMGDVGSLSSGTSSGSQDLILKCHRSNEDIFLSPPIPALRETNSAPPQSRSKGIQELPRLPKSVRKVITGQQRHSILSAANGNRVRHRSLETITPNLSGISVFTEDNCGALAGDTTSAYTLNATNPDNEDAANADTQDPSNADTQAPCDADTQDPCNADTQDPPNTDTQNSNANIEDIRSHPVRTPAARDKIDTNGTQDPPEMSLQKLTERMPIRRKKRTSKSSWPIEYTYRSARNLPAPQWNELIAGARVLAKWPSDGHYYFGRVAQKAPGIDRWHVVFDDNNALILPKRDLLVTKIIPKRHPVFARKAGEDEYHPSVISDLVDDGCYIVSCVDSNPPTEYKVSSVDICLDANQFNNLKISLLSHRDLSSTDDGEVNSRRYQHQPSVSAYGDNQPSVSGIAKHSTPTIIAQPMQPLLSAEAIAKRSRIFSDIQRSPVKVTTLKPKKSGSSEIANRCLSFGRSATTSSSVYRGFLFMVTHLCNNKRVGVAMLNLDIPEDDETQSHEEGDEETDIDGETICAQIEALGGVVIDKFDIDAISAAKRTFLISTGFQRTVKYLQCLAANILPVSYKWVEQCYLTMSFRSEKDYLLPAGVDISGKTVEWRTRVEGQCLKDVSIYIPDIPSEKTFSSDWKSILLKSGAIVIPKISINSGVTPHYILASRDNCTKSLLNRANRLKVPIVTPEWAIQRLITGIPLEASYHPTFQITSL